MYESLNCPANTKNQLNTCFGYDIAGNLVQNGSIAYTYDAENRLVGTAGWTYTYDGDGKRVMKSNGSTGTLYWTGVGSDALAESSLTGIINEEYMFFNGQRVARVDHPSNLMHFYFADVLGSAGATVSINGTDPATQATIDSEADYYPYGGEIPLISDPNNHYKFTGKERDTESGLDNFGKRYHASSLGRFMTPDPLLNSGQPWNPQTWNRYSYTLNNPLRYTDPLGLYVWGNCSGDADKCKAEQQRFRDSIANLKKAAEGLKEGSKERKKIEGVLGKLGEEGKGNIKINFGDAGTTNGLPNLGKTVGNSITLNYDAADSVKSDYHLNASDSSALDAGLTGHEGTHAGGGPSVFGFLGMHGEKSAYTNESIIYQGLHNTDRPTLLWNESWATLDEQTLNQTRDQAVQHVLHPDKVEAPIPHVQGNFPE